MLIITKWRHIDPQNVQRMQKSVVLQTLDSHWRDHLAAMDHLRQGIHLRGYAQKNPAQEFKRESFNMFTDMLSSIKYEVVSTLSKIQLVDETQAELIAPQPVTHLSFQHAEISSLNRGYRGSAEAQCRSIARHRTNGSAPRTQSRPQ